jgi:hypothetical protein
VAKCPGPQTAKSKKAWHLIVESFIRKLHDERGTNPERAAETDAGETSRDFRTTRRVGDSVHVPSNGFYNATYVRPISVQRINGPVPYYLVQMRGNVAGSAQTFYAAVLDDGNLVRPVPVSRHAYHPVRRSREKWRGVEEKKKPRVRALREAAAQGMGGAELKGKWGGSEEKPSN